MTSIPYYLSFAMIWLFSLIPYWLIYLISDGLYFIIYHIVRYRKSTVFRNLRTSFPEKTEVEITQLAKAFYHHFSDFLLEISKCIRISAGDLEKRMKYLNPEVFTRLAEEGKNIALVSAHYNNWEMMNNIPLIMEHECLIIYRPLKSQVADKISLFMRRRFGAVMTPMENIFRESLKYRSEGKLFSIWFLADQRPPRKTKFWTRFLNHDTAFFEGVEKMSKKLGMSVVFMDVQKVRRGYYEVNLEKLFDNASLTKENEVTLACVRRMEEVIIKKPEFWLWSHKRFKHTKPEEFNLITT
jgi:KDO2-lipid IV(A) lauroyltransferase